MAADPLATGRCVLAGFDKGRARINDERRQRGELIKGMVLELAAAELASGARRRGLAKRIAPRLGIGERHTNRILDSLISESDFFCQDAGSPNHTGQKPKEQLPCKATK